MLNFFLLYSAMCLRSAHSSLYHPNGPLAGEPIDCALSKIDNVKLMTTLACPLLMVHYLCVAIWVIIAHEYTDDPGRKTSYIPECLYYWQLWLHAAIWWQQRFIGYKVLFSSYWTIICDKGMFSNITASYIRYSNWTHHQGTHTQWNDYTPHRQLGLPCILRIWTTKRLKPHWKEDKEKTGNGIWPIHWRPWP